jgi:hypothetical protein
VFVNDGSRDNTLAACSIAGRSTGASDRQPVAQLRREAALTAGIDSAGDVIVPMDTTRRTRRS